MQPRRPLGTGTFFFACGVHSFAALATRCVFPFCHTGASRYPAQGRKALSDEGTPKRRKTKSEIADIVPDAASQRDEALAEVFIRVIHEGPHAVFFVSRAEFFDVFFADRIAQAL